MVVADTATTVAAIFAAVAALAAWATVATSWLQQRKARQPNISAGFLSHEASGQAAIQFVNMGARPRRTTGLPTLRRWLRRGATRRARREWAPPSRGARADHRPHTCFREDDHFRLGLPGHRPTTARVELRGRAQETTQGAVPEPRGVFQAHVPRRSPPVSQCRGGRGCHPPRLDIGRLRGRPDRWLERCGSPEVRSRPCAGSVVSRRLSPSCSTSRMTATNCRHGRRATPCVSRSGPTTVRLQVRPGCQLERRRVRCAGDLGLSSGCRAQRVKPPLGAAGQPFSARPGSTSDSTARTVLRR